MSGSALSENTGLHVVTCIKPDSLASRLRLSMYAEFILKCRLILTLG